MKMGFLLSELGRLLGMDDLKLNDNGVASLEFDKRITTHFEPSPDGENLWLYAAVCNWPEETSQQAMLATIFLEANLWANGTAGATFALDSAAGEIVLERQIPLTTTTGESMRRQLEQFVEVVDVWMTRIRTGTDLHQPSSHSKPPEDGMVFFVG